MKIKLILLVFLIVSASGCIELSVYVPHKGNPLPSREDKTVLPEIEVRDPFQEKQAETYFARRSPCLFFSARRKIQNLYGIPSQIIRDELQNYGHLYFSAKNPYSKIIIEIRKFDLFSNDRCFKNIVSLETEISVSGITSSGTEMIMDFKYKDEIQSRVTELYLLSVIGTIPVTFHASFRGNRQDQMNELARIAFRNFFDELSLYFKAGITDE